MKALGKLFGELTAWRWAPAVGLCVASLFYVLVVVALVPDEIGVPVTNARFAKKPAPTDEAPELPTYPTAAPETESAPAPQIAQVQPAGVVDFGRRGFSPPIDRPEPPPPPSPPPPPPPVMAPPPVVPPDPALAQQPIPGSVGAEPPVAVMPTPPPGVDANGNVGGSPAVPPGMNPAIQALRRFPFGRGMKTPQAPQAPQPPPGSEPPAVPVAPPPTQ